MGIITYILLSLIVGVAAENRFNRTGIAWFFFSLIGTPIFSFLFMLALGKNK